MVSLTGTLVNNISTLIEANIPLLGLSVCRIYINSWVDFMSCLLGTFGVMNCFIIFVNS